MSRVAAELSVNIKIKQNAIEIREKHKQGNQIKIRKYIGPLIAYSILKYECATPNYWDTIRMMKVYNIYRTS